MERDAIMLWVPAPPAPVLHSLSDLPTAEEPGTTVRRREAGPPEVSSPHPTPDRQTSQDFKRAAKSFKDEISKSWEEQAHENHQIQVLTQKPEQPNTGARTHDGKEQTLHLQLAS